MPSRSLGITLHDLLALGRQNPNDPSESFNMAYLAVRGSGAVNGVSRLHGKVSRQLFAPLFPRWPADEMPVGHVTNGVHMSTWDSAPADDLWTAACGKDRWLGTTETMEQDIRRVSDASLWQFRNAARTALVDYARERLSRELALSGAAPEAVDRAKHLFDPTHLTLGFARRFATYKRPDLLLHDPARLLRLLANAKRPVQLIIAGKAHPEDKAGQALIQQWIRFIRRPEVRPHAIFLSDYDMLLTEQLVQGVDVWLNTPRRPWEACGTSGMKVLVNGGINLSELDGWWAEAYTPEVGWALGDGREHDGDPAWDAVEADALYDLLEREVIPEFYARDEERHAHRLGQADAGEHGAVDTALLQQPRGARIHRATLPSGGDRLPLARCRQRRNRRQNRRLAAQPEQKWAALRFGEVKSRRDGGQHVFEVEVYLNDLDPEAVRVELYADGVLGSAPCGRRCSAFAHRPTRGRLRLQRCRVRGPPSDGLHGASDTALRWRFGPAGGSANPLSQNRMDPRDHERMVRRPDLRTRVRFRRRGLVQERPASRQVRWILVRDSTGLREPQAFLCTDANREPDSVLPLFVFRWRIETTFQEVREHLGVDQRQWSDLAILPTTPALLGLYSLIALWAHGLATARNYSVQPHAAAWYEKSQPTFSDAIAAVCHVLWMPEDFSSPATSRNRRNSRAPASTTRRDSILSGVNAERRAQKVVVIPKCLR